MGQTQCGSSMDTAMLILTPLKHIQEYNTNGNTLFQKQKLNLSVEQSQLNMDRMECNRACYEAQSCSSASSPSSAATLDFTLGALIGAVISEEESEKISYVITVDSAYLGHIGQRTFCPD